eukprot:GHVR01013855.1.p1 GENE.GHVR01013855.1~~GHVR01013855.1.p1  ORF type:complete len:216 (+),score=49.61 GHVR01013855.1:64-711(+)
MGANCTKQSDDLETEIMVANDLTQPQVVAVDEEQEKEIEIQSADEEAEDKSDEEEKFEGSPLQRLLHDVNKEGESSKAESVRQLKTTVRQWWKDVGDGIEVRYLKDGQLIPAEFKLPYGRPVSKFTITYGTTIETRKFEEFNSITRDQQSIEQMCSSAPVDSTILVQGEDASKAILMVLESPEETERFFVCSKVTWRLATKRRGSSGAVTPRSPA